MLKLIVLYKGNKKMEKKKDVKYIACSFCGDIYGCYRNFDFNFCSNCGLKDICEKDKGTLIEGSFCNKCMDKSMATLQEEENAKQ